MQEKLYPKVRFIDVLSEVLFKSALHNIINIPDSVCLSVVVR